MLGSIAAGDIYRTSTVLSVWKKTVLLDLLKSRENPWQFEVLGTVRSDKYDGFYSTNRQIIRFINGVIKGKWERGALTKLSQLKVQIDPGRRSVMTRWESLVFRSHLLRNHFLMLFTPKLRRHIKTFFSRTA